MEVWGSRKVVGDQEGGGTEEGMGRVRGGGVEEDDGREEEYRRRGRDREVVKEWKRGGVLGREMGGEGRVGREEVIEKGGG